MTGVPSKIGGIVVATGSKVGDYMGRSDVVVVMSAPAIPPSLRSIPRMLLVSPTSPLVISALVL